MYIVSFRLTNLIEKKIKLAPGNVITTTMHVAMEMEFENVTCLDTQGLMRAERKREHLRPKLLMLEL